MIYSKEKSEQLPEKEESRKGSAAWASGLCRSGWKIVKWKPIVPNQSCGVLMGIVECPNQGEVPKGGVIFADWNGGIPILAKEHWWGLRRIVQAGEHQNRGSRIVEWNTGGIILTKECWWELSSSRPRLRSTERGVFSTKWNSAVPILLEGIEQWQFQRRYTKGEGIDSEMEFRSINPGRGVPTGINDDLS